MSKRKACAGSSVRELLKQAKAAIAAEDWTAASKACAGVLKQEPSSYLAWVLMGLAMTHLDINKSIQSYQKAIAIQGDQPTAYQGLIKLLSDLPSVDDSQLDLLRETLKSLSEEALSPDHAKQGETLEQLAAISFQTARYPLCVETWKKYICLTETKENEEKLSHAFATVMNSLLEWENKDPSNVETINSIRLDFISLAQTDETKEELAKELFDRTRKSAENISETIRIAEKLISLVPYFWDPIEYLCIIKQVDGYQNEAKEYCESDLVAKQMKFFPRQPLSNINEGISLASVSETQGRALNLLQSNLKLYSYGLGWLVLARLYLARNSNSVFDSVKRGMLYAKKLSEEHPEFILNTLRSDLLFCMVSAYEESKKYKEALQVLYRIQKINENYENLLQKLAAIEFEVGNLEKAEELYKKILEQSPNDHTSQAKLGQVSYQQQDFVNAQEYLEKAIANDASRGEYYYWLAEVFWCRGQQNAQTDPSGSSEFIRDKKFVLSNLLRSAKLNPTASETFASLGRFYEKIAIDLPRAKRCYQKSLLLDSFNELAGKQLSSMLVAEGNETEAILIYRDVLRLGPGNLRSLWAWRNMAFYYLKTQHYEEALNCFQSVLRVDPEDFRALHGLGSCYKSQGMLIASLRVFNTLLEKQESQETSEEAENSQLEEILYEIANIHFALGLYEDAIPHYKQVLAKNLRNDLTSQATREISECFFALAQEEFRSGLYLRCAKSLQIAAKTILSIEIPDSIQLLKLKGDIFATAYFLSEEYVLSFTGDKNDTNKAKNEKKLWASAASESYRSAVELEDKNSYLHYDLAVSYWQQSQITGESNELARESLKRALTLNPQEVKFWNALASIEVNPEVQQHLLVRALEIDETNAETWCNLMAFYIQHRDFDLASQCHIKVITYDPELPRVWTCFALMKEVQMQEKEKNEHQIALEDFYAFAVEMNPRNSFVKQSLAYYTSDAYVGVFVLQKCVERNPNDANSWNLLGLLQEQTNQLSTALYSFQQSHKLLEHDTKLSNQNSLGTWPQEEKFTNSANFATASEKLLKIKLNIARLMCKLKMYSDCITQYREILPFVSGDLERQNSFYVFALFRSGDVAGALDELKKQKKLYPEAASCVHDFCRFSFANGKPEEAYSTIYEFAKNSKRQDSWRLLCSLSIQLMKPDTHDHLKYLQTHPESGVQDIMLEAIFFIRNENFAAAKRVFCKALHVEPFNASIRACFIEFLASYYPNDTKSLWQAVKNHRASPALREIDSFELCNEITAVAKATLVMGKERNVSAVEALRKAKSSVLAAIRVSPLNVMARYIAVTIAFGICSLGRCKQEEIESCVRMMKQTVFFLSVSRFGVSVPPALLFHSELMLVEVELMYNDANNALEKLQELQQRSQSIPLPDESKKRISILLLRAEYLCNKLTSDELLKRAKEALGTATPLVNLEFLALLIQTNSHANEVRELFLKLLSQKMNPSDRLLVLMSASQYFYRIGEFVVAKNTADEAYKVSGRRSDAFVLMKGAVHVSMKDWKNGLQALQRCLVINGNIPLANFLLLQIHLNVRKPEAAESDALFELDNNSHFHLPYVLLAYLAESAHQKEAALDFLSKAKQFTPSKENISKDLHDVTS